MKGVLLRCPRCGTTQEQEGECNACHEAQAKYFCANHDLGRWLDAPQCSQCGARFGDPIVSPSSIRPFPEAPASPSRRERVERTPERAPSVRTGPWDTGRWGTRKKDRVIVPRPSERYDRHDDPESDHMRESPETYIELPRATLLLGGCLRSVISILFFMFFLFLLFSLFLGGTLIQFFP